MRFSSRYLSATTLFAILGAASPAFAYTLTVNFEASESFSLAGRSARDEQTVTFGLRSFTTRGSQFAVNNRTTFLRGRHDACVFALTGHPPMDVAGWTRYFQIVKSWGHEAITSPRDSNTLNHPPTKSTQRFSTKT